MVLAALCSLLLAHPQAPQRPALVVGDTAPPLQVKRWILGQPVAGYERGKTYLIEIWATWCGPCVAAMPHLGKLQERYRGQGLVVIGLTGPDDYGNTEKSVTSMILDKKPAYRVAWDQESDKPYEGVFKGATIKGLMGAAEFPSIPVAFIVDKSSHVAYIGHPLASEQTLNSVLAGTFDLAKAATAYGRQLDAKPELDRFCKLTEAGENAMASELGRKLVKESYFDDAHALLVIASTIQSTKHPKGRDLALGLDAAKRAVVLTNWGDPGYVGCLATAHFQLGHTAEAIRIVRRAIAIADGGQREALKKDLAKYQRHNA